MHRYASLQTVSRDHNPVATVKWSLHDKSPIVIFPHPDVFTVFIEHMVPVASAVPVGHGNANRDALSFCQMKRNLVFAVIVRKTGFVLAIRSLFRPPRFFS